MQYTTLNIFIAYGNAVCCKVVFRCAQDTLMELNCYWS